MKITNIKKIYWQQMSNTDSNMVTPLGTPFLRTTHRSVVDTHVALKSRSDSELKNFINSTTAEHITRNAINGDDRHAQKWFVERRRQRPRV